MRASWPLVTVAAACTLALGACSKVVDSADAPHDSGSTAEVVRPAAPDSPPGGPSGIAGSAAHTGSSGGDAVPGATGEGTANASSAQPGVGLDGGLGSSTATMGAAGASAPAVPSGSANTTPGTAVGSRP